MKTVKEELRELNWHETGDGEFKPMVLFSNEVIKADWLGTPYAWTHTNDYGKEREFETFEELIEFLKTT